MVVEAVAAGLAAVVAEASAVSAAAALVVAVQEAIGSSHEIVWCANLEYNSSAPTLSGMWR